MEKTGAEIIRDGLRTVISAGGTEICELAACGGAKDSFEQIEDGAFLWRRRTETPVTEMKMELLTAYKPEFTMVPSVNYNGNGWGSTPEYTGDSFAGEPWTYTYSRVTLPACTYSEGREFAVSVMAEEYDVCSCSLYLDGERERHSLIWPETEGPKILMRHFWEKRFDGKMEPRSEFCAIIHICRVEHPRMQYRSMLDFAWRYYARPIKPARSTEELYRFSTVFMKKLYCELENGFCGFSRGYQWYFDTSEYAKIRERNFEIGWVGQNASICNAMLYEYLRSNDTDALEKGINTLDSWLRFAYHGDTGLLESIVDFHPWRWTTKDNEHEPDKYVVGEACYETRRVGTVYRRDKHGYILLATDACNLGGGALQLFESAELAEKCGKDGEKYRDAALGICRFALSQQQEDGQFAKTWTEEGEVLTRGGTIGCFLVPALIKAYSVTGDEKYLAAAQRGFGFYCGEFERDGFTTAGALDSYCIDKESASPLLLSCLMLYDAVKDRKYIKLAEDTAWYLCTWMMHYTVKYPEDCQLSQMRYNTFGATSVSTAHQALDPYALHDVISFMRLSELTGNIQWRERALVFWANASQGISDGTLYLGGRYRPLGAQDEAIFHTRWGRYGVKPFRPSQWLPAWVCAFRMEVLRYTDKTEELDRGLETVTGTVRPASNQGSAK